MSVRVRIIHNEKINGTQVEYRADILDSEYSGSVIEKKAGGVFFDWEYDLIDERAPFDQPVQKSSFQCQYLVEQESDTTILDDILDADEERFQIKFYINSTLQWSGSVLTDLMEYPEGQRKFTAQITAKDLSVLNAKEFPRASVATRTKISEIIAECLQATGLDLPIRSFTNLTHSNGNINQSNDFLFELYHQKLAFQNKDTQFTYLEVLEHICRAYNLIIRQANNTWIVEQLPAVAKGDDVQFDYDSDGLNPTSSTPARAITIDQSNNFLLNTSRNRITGALKRISSTYLHRSGRNVIDIPDTTQDSQFDVVPTFVSDFGAEFGDTFTLSLDSEVTLASNSDFVSTSAYVKVVLIGTRRHMDSDGNFGASFTYIPVSVSGGSTSLTGSLSVTGTIPASLTEITGIQVSFHWAEPITGKTIDSVAFTNVIAVLVNSERDWGASTENTYTQTGNYSIEETIPPTVLGDDPQGIGSPAHDALVSADLAAGGFKIRGVSEGVDLQEITLRERMKMRRNPLRGLRADLWMTFSPANLLIYDSKTWFFLGGYFSAKQSRWNATLISFDYLAAVGDEFSDYRPDDGIGGGGSGDANDRFFSYNSIGKITENIFDENRTSIDVELDLPVRVGIEYWIVNESELSRTDRFAGIYPFIPSGTAGAEFGPGEITLSIEEQLFNVPEGSFIFKSPDQSEVDDNVFQDRIDEAQTELDTLNNTTLPNLNAELDQLETDLADAQTQLDAVLPITETKISDGAISTPKLQTNSITAGKIVTGAITAIKIAAGAIIAEKIGADAVTANKISAGAVTANKIDVADLAAINATMGNLDINAKLTILSGGEINLDDDLIIDSDGLFIDGTSLIGGVDKNKINWDSGTDRAEFYYEAVTSPNAMIMRTIGTADMSISSAAELRLTAENNTEIGFNSGDTVAFTAVSETTDLPTPTEVGYIALSVNGNTRYIRTYTT